MEFRCTYAVRVKTAEDKEKAIQAIRERDSRASLDPEGNPTTFWITTNLDEREIEKMNEVEDVITAHGQYHWPCICGSGKPSWPESDARGIPLGRVCEDCMEEKLGSYRPEVLEDPNYEADEPIEPED